MLTEVEFNQRLKWALILCLVAFIFLCIWLPLQLFIPNQSELTSGLIDLLALPLKAGLGCLIVVPVVLALLPTMIFRPLFGLGVGLLVLTFIQSTILVWNYGAFAGEEPAWDNFKWESRFEIVLWLVGIVSAVIWSGTIWSAKSRLLSFLTILTIVNVAWIIGSNEIRFRSKSESTHTDRAFEFSKSSNVVVLLLDAFQSALFERVLESYNEYPEIFKDFTYFRNATSSFAATAGSLPVILSGQEYDNKLPYTQFLTDRFAPNALPTRLDTYGVDSTVISLPQFCDHLRGQSLACSSLRQLRDKDQYARVKRETLNLIDLVLFRAVPQILKIGIYSEDRWLVERTFGETENRELPPTHSNSLAFIDMLTERTRASLNQPALKFFHIFIPHAPQRLTAECEVAEKGRKGMVRHLEQGACALKLAKRMLQTLHENKLYESSMIVILADHGSGVHFDKTQRIKDGPPIDHARPLILVKRSGVTQDRMKTNDAPVQLLDMSATIENYFGDKGLKDLFSIARDEQRIRLYRHYRWSNPMWRREFFPPMTVYEIKGDVWNPESWMVIASP